MVAVSAGIASFFLTKGRVLSVTAGAELETDDNLFHLGNVYNSKSRTSL
jgi:hypothetical protein